jgi:Tfp pilus assembly protein PilF
VASSLDATPAAPAVERVAVPTDAPRVKPSRTVSLAVVLAALVVYAGTLTFDFVWDDTLLIQRSHQLHRWHDLGRALTSHFWAEVQEASHYYRPLVTLSFFVDLRLWGLNPAGFHLTNVLAHLAAALAVLALARRVTGDEIAAGAAALLFALHPLHSESVAFVSGRSDVLAGLFFVLAVVGYARWRDTGGRIAWLGSLIAFFLALTAKEVALTLPLALALYDWSRRRGGGLRAVGRALLRYVPYAGVVGVYATIRVTVLGGLVDADGGAWAPLVVRILTGLKIVGWYTWLALVPYPANAYYPIVPVVPPPGLTWWLCVGWLALALGLSGVALLRSRALGFGALWFWATLIPFTIVNFLPLSAPIMAERFLYLPSVGVCLILGLAIRRALGEMELIGDARQLPGVPAIAVAVLLIVYGSLTLSRNEDWKNDYRLYLWMVETSPEAALPHVNLAFTQISRGEIPEASVHLKRAVEILPTNARALVGLALTQTVLGDREAGLQNAMRAYAYDPRHHNVLSTLGAIFLYRDEPARAVTFLESSLESRPNQVNAVLNLALALSKLGRQAEAEKTLARGLALTALMEPRNGWAHRVVAEVYVNDPARARPGWENYIAWLKSIPEPGPSYLADLAHAERQLARIVSAPPGASR